MPALNGKVAIVTGATKGIGRAICRLFAAEGARVVAVARTQDLLADLKLATLDHAGEVRTVVGDVREQDTAQRAVHQAIDSFEGLDILVNNAGVAIYHPIWELTIEDYDSMMDTNMRSTFLFTRAAVPFMRESREGVILNIGSIAGTRGFPNETAYCASKFAQVGFAQALDQELREYNIKVSSILPGGVATELAMGTGRTAESVASAGYLEAEDVARAALFAVTQEPRSRILEVRMRPMSEPL
ncbi:MAG: SDR family oxidoreductase [Chloroflexota bacterium]|nr:MAG: short-chain dehydrogenase [Chloroflexota bacterium]